MPTDTTQNLSSSRPRPSRWASLATTFAAALVVSLSLIATYAAFPEFRPAATHPSLWRLGSDLARTPDPIQRDALAEPFSPACRKLDAQLPPDARVFLSGMLGPDIRERMAIYYFLNYYLFPRDLDISLGEPAQLLATGSAPRTPSRAELAAAGYDLEIEPVGWELKLHWLNPQSMTQPAKGLQSYPSSDPWLAFLLPPAVALAGTRLLRWLFPDLSARLSAGETFACGLALGAFFVAQSALALRMAGLRLERPLIILLFCWAALELTLYLRRWWRQALCRRLRTRLVVTALAARLPVSLPLSPRGLGGTPGLRRHRLLGPQGKNTPHLRRQRALAVVHQPAPRFRPHGLPLARPHAPRPHLWPPRPRQRLRPQVLESVDAAERASGRPRRRRLPAPQALGICRRHHPLRHALPDRHLQPLGRRRHGHDPLRRPRLHAAHAGPGRKQWGASAPRAAAAPGRDHGQVRRPDSADDLGGLLLLATRAGRFVLAPWRKFVLTLVCGALACIPYVVLLLHHPVRHPKAPGCRCSSSTPRSSSTTPPRSGSQSSPNV